VALTFTSFCLIFVVFRSQDLATAWSMFRRMFSVSDGAGLPLQVHGLYLTFAVVALGHALGQAKLGWRIWQGLPAPVRGLAFGTAVTLALVLAPGASKAFIYFQF
jgi:hypothetical protein